MDIYPVDLHSHTNFSDGELDPSQLVQLAASRGVQVLAITDHDTVSGLAEGIEAGEKYGIRVVGGVEMSVQEEDASIHLLGLGIEWQRPEVVEFFKGRLEKRTERLLKMVSLLNGMGVMVDGDELLASIKGQPGRKHLAMKLEAMGVVSEVGAFKKYIGKGMPAYVSYPRLSMGEAIRTLLSWGAVPVLAHPDSSMGEGDFAQWAEDGLCGVEVYHPSIRAVGGRRGQLIRWAERYGLLLSGGSDYHPTKGERYGRVFMPGDLGVTLEQFQLIEGVHRELGELGVEGFLEKRRLDRERLRRDGC